MDLGGKTTTVTLLNQGNSELHSKYLSLYSHISIGPTPNQRNRILTRTTSDQKVKKQEIMCCTVPTFLSTTQLLHLRVRDHSRRWGRKTARAKEMKSSTWVFISWECQRSNTYEVSAWLPTEDRVKDIFTRPGNDTKGKPSRPHPRQRSTGT